MSNLVVTTLDSEVEQPMDLTLERRYPVKSISFWLYLSNAAPGSVLTIKVKDSIDAVLVSQAVPIATIQTQLGATGDYSHGKYMWTPPSNLILGEGSYTLSLEQTTGYTSGTYIGWCKDWAGEYITVNGAVTYSSDKPYFFRLYTYKDRI